MTLQTLEANGIQFIDTTLAPIWEKVRAGERLSFDEGVTMLQSDDFPALGKMGDYRKRLVSGNKVYFVLNRHINPTNICVLSCSFCDFAKKPGDPDAYELSTQEILDSIDPEMG